jgi:hypothetical protein
MSVLAIFSVISLVYFLGKIYIMEKHIRSVHTPWIPIYGLAEPICVECSNYDNPEKRVYVSYPCATLRALGDK